MSSRYKRPETVDQIHPDAPDAIFLAPPHPKFPEETRPSSEVNLWGDEGTRYVRADKVIAFQRKLDEARNDAEKLRVELSAKLDGLPEWENEAKTLARALIEVCKATVDYLVPQGIDAEDALIRIIAETDNREISPLINEYRHVLGLD